MKQNVTKFDLETAFKELDELNYPEADKIIPNKTSYTDSFSRADKFEALLEDYYDIRNPKELEAAKEDREEEIAKAKLARIEKIVDLDAKSADDLLPSYVGKVIVQCPQCMTLFYKDMEDIVKSDTDETIVNVEEECQHCGNTSGYTLIGKVDSVTPEVEESVEEVPAEEPVEELPAVDEIPAEETAEEETATEEISEPVEETAEGSTEETAEETAEEEVADENADLDLEIPEEEEDEEVKESLNEEIEDLDAKLKAQAEYIDYLREMIKQEEKALEKATNEKVKEAIQRRLDAFNQDLLDALPEDIKDEAIVEELPTPEEVEVSVDEEVVKECLNESKGVSIGISKKNFNKYYTEVSIETVLSYLESNNLVEENSVVDFKFKDLGDSIMVTDITYTADLEEDYEIKNEWGHYAIYKDGKLVSTADTVSEAEQDIRDLEKEEITEDLTKEEVSKLANDCKKADIKTIDELNTFAKETEGDVLAAIDSVANKEEAELEPLLAEELEFEPAEVKELEIIEEICEDDLTNCIEESLKKSYSNVNSFNLTDCSLNENLIIEGEVEFKGGFKKAIKYTFTEALKNNSTYKLKGISEDVDANRTFEFICKVDNTNLLTESFK